MRRKEEEERGEGGCVFFHDDTDAGEEEIVGQGQLGGPILNGGALLPNKGDRPALRVRMHGLARREGGRRLRHRGNAREGKRPPVDQVQVQVVDLQVLEGLDARLAHVLLPLAVVPQLAGDLVCVCARACD